MTSRYSEFRIDETEAGAIANQLYGLDWQAKALPGEFDFNFEIRGKSQSFLLKISRPGQDIEFLRFQNAILEYISRSDRIKNPVRVIPSVTGETISATVTDISDRRFVRLLDWVEGKLWSKVNPKTSELRRKLGCEIGSLSVAISGFDHPFAHKNHDWVLATSDWTLQHTDLFETDRNETVQLFQKRFAEIQPIYKNLRKSVIHGDVNDNNIIVGDNIEPVINGIIDYGDANYSQTINELAISLAYAIMHCHDPVAAASEVTSGFHSQFPLQPEEIACLHTLVGMRLVTTVTKSALNKIQEPDNAYLLVSEKPAWNALESWANVDAELVECHLRKACGLPPHRNEQTFVFWANENSVSVNKLFPTLDCQNVQTVDMGVSSAWLGHESEIEDLDLMEFKLAKLRQRMPSSLIAGGYLETRPIYSTDAYRVQSNEGYEYRTVHLGTDFWVPSETPIHAICNGVVESVFDNRNHKDYGPTIIIRHIAGDCNFFVLYGHLSKSSLRLHEIGDEINTGDRIGYIGGHSENGCWATHLHFQIMLSMLGNEHDFPGVSTHIERDIWKSICPDPGNLFVELPTCQLNDESCNDELISYRRNHLGKGMSISYDQPLQMVRGSGVYLIDHTGRRYLDTVNNVAHVGHEHPRIVKAAQEQIALLNTNTRYLNGAINEFAEALLATFPNELSVVHFVNSGSEANELAIRMAKTVTGQNDFIAVEVGYHGNTNGCVDVSSYKFDGKGGTGAPQSTHVVPLPDTFRGIYGNKDVHRYAEHVEQQLERIQKLGRSVAGFICESIISCGGQIELPETYLSSAYAAVRNAGGVCIADEVQTGCGRVGHHFWAFELHGVVPDIVTIGKPIGNGHPLAAVVCTQTVAEAFANGMEYFNTFGGNPVSCVIGREVLRVIEHENLQQNALETGEYLKSGLIQLANTFPFVQDVRGQGLFLGFELADSQRNPLPHHALYLTNRMRQRGILMSTDGKDHNVIKIKPPMVFLKPHADHLIANLSTVLAEDFFRIR